MTHTQLKDYLKKYRIDSEEQLAKHIEELKRNTIPNNEIIFPLVDLLLNEKSVLLSFFRENSKERGEATYVRTITPFFLDEAIYSTRHKAREEGKFHKEPFLVDVSPLGYKDTNRLVEIKLERKDESHYIPTNATNIEVFHLSTKDNGDKTAFIGFKIENGNFSFVEVPFTSPKVVEKDKSSTEKDDVITNSIRGEKETMEYLQGVKETEGKLNYELDWEFIQQMAERMSQNKGKYEPYNWKRPMEVEKLKQSLLRHVVEVMKGNYSDDGREFGHFESIALNSMMINYQLKVK